MYNYDCQHNITGNLELELNYLLVQHINTANENIFQHIRYLHKYEMKLNNDVVYQCPNTHSSMQYACIFIATSTCIQARNTNNSH